MSTLHQARPTSHSYFSQRLKLHYLDWGNETAPPVLLVHGSQDHCHNWDWTSEILCRDYHVIVPDLRGHGDSEWSKGGNYSNLDYVYDIAQLVEQLDRGPVHLIGHSLGGTIVSLFAGLYPQHVRSTICVEGVGSFWWQEVEKTPAPERTRNWIDAMRAQAGRTPRRYDSLETALARMQSSNPHLSDDRARHLTIHGSNRNEDGTYTWKFDNYTHTGMLSSLTHNEITSIWEEISCPMLIINATEGFEHRIGQDGSEQHFSALETVNVADAGHWLHHDQFDTFMDLTRAFLARNRMETVND